jgi:hypothetical protein
MVRPSKLTPPNLGPSLFVARAALSALMCKLKRMERSMANDMLLPGARRWPSRYHRVLPLMAHVRRRLDGAGRAHDYIPR